MYLLLWGKDETPDIEDLGSVLCNSSVKTLHLPTISLFSLRSNNEKFETCVTDQGCDGQMIWEPNII